MRTKNGRCNYYREWWFVETRTTAQGVLANYTLMISVPGIGEITAIFILCCTNNFAIKISGKQLASYAGVVPCEHTSGTSVKGRNKVNSTVVRVSTNHLATLKLFPHFF